MMSRREKTKRRQRAVRRGVEQHIERRRGRHYRRGERGETREGPLRRIVKLPALTQRAASLQFFSIIPRLPRRIKQNPRKAAGGFVKPAAEKSPRGPATGLT